MKEYELEVTTITRTKRKVLAEDIHRAIVKAEEDTTNEIAGLLSGEGHTPLSIKAKAVKRNSH